MAHADKEYKVILVGDPAVGKTAFVRRFVTNQFDTGYRATMGGKQSRSGLLTYSNVRFVVEYSSKIVHVDGTSVKINVGPLQRFFLVVSSYFLFLLALGHCRYA